MANLYYADRCFETTSSQGTGTIGLLGAQSGFRTVKTGLIQVSGDAVGPWDCYYVMEDGTNWEVGRGTLTAGIPDTLSRSSILASSNGNAAVNWGPGTRNVFVVAPASVFNGLANLAGTNTFLANQVLKLVDAGAGEGPLLTLFRDSASPAANDLLGAIPFDARSSTAAQRTFAKILAQLLDPVNATEDAILALQTIVAGTLATRMTVGQGIQIGAPTGGDPGSGKLNAAADLLINNTGVRLQGRQTIWVPAHAMYPRSTNGAELTTTETPTNKVIRKNMAYDPATQEFAQFAVRFPKAWNHGTVTAIPIWLAESGTGGVVWAIQGITKVATDGFDVAFGTEQTSTQTLTGAFQFHAGPETAAITLGGTPATGFYSMFQVKRNVSDASDTLGADALLLGVVILFSLNAANDL